MSATRIRVLVIDDNQLARLGIVGLLEAEPALEVVAVASGGAEALHLYETTRPDVVTVDMRMPGIDGVRTITLLRAHDPEARILVLSHFEGEADVFRALDAGALGYMGKDDPGAHIVKAIEAVSKGVHHMPPRIAEKRQKRDGASVLSARECRILQLARQGQSNREIAASIGLSEKTVEKNLRDVFRKLGVANRTEAVGEAIRRGYVFSGL